MKGWPRCAGPICPDGFAVRAAPKPSSWLKIERRFIPSRQSPSMHVVYGLPSQTPSLWYRFDANDYSVPVRYAHHFITMKGYVDRVLLCCEEETVAEHRRSWDKEGFFSSPYITWRFWKESLVRYIMRCP